MTEGRYETALRKLKQINQLDPYYTWSVYPDHDTEHGELWIVESSKLRLSNKSYFRVIDLAHEHVTAEYPE